MICCAQVLLLAPSSYLKRAGREGGASLSLRRWGCAPCYARRGHRDSRGDIPLNQRRTNQGTKHRQTPDLLSQPREELTARLHSASGTANAGKWRQDLSEDSHPSISNFYRKVQSDLQESRCTMHTKYSRVYFSSLIILQRPETYKAYCFVLANPCTPSRPRPLTELWRKQGWDWPEITRCHWDLMHLNANENFKLVPKSRLPPRSLS